MSGYEELLARLKRGATHLFVAMLAVLYFSTDTITAEELQEIMTAVSMSYDTSTNVLTNGESNYTIDGLISYVITTDTYRKSLTVSQSYVENIIDTAKSYSLITSEQAATLGALL